MPYYRTCPYCGAHLDPGERLPRQRAAYTTGGEKGGEHPLTFYQYLATIKDEASPAGDPARDALGDDTFPKEADTRG